MNTFLRKKTNKPAKRKKERKQIKKEQNNKRHMSLKFPLDKIINLEYLNH